MMKFFLDAYKECAIVVTLENEWEEREIWISIWQAVDGHLNCKCWRCRLRHIKRVLTDGHPFEGMVILTLEDAIKFAHQILKYADIPLAGSFEDEMSKVK